MKRELLARAERLLQAEPDEAGSAEMERGLIRAAAALAPKALERLRAHEAEGVTLKPPAKSLPWKKKH